VVYLSSSCVKALNVLDAISAMSPISKNIELSGGSNANDELLDSLSALKSEGYNFLVHGYFPPPKEHFLLNFADTSDKTRDFIRKSLAFMRQLDVSYYSTHAGFTSDFTIGSKENLEGGKSTFGYDGVAQNIDWFFENSDGAGLALENLFPNNGDDKCCFWMTPERIAEALEADGRIDLLLDFGHLKISGEHFGFDWTVAAKEMLGRFGNRIKEIHLSENGGKYDEHLPITQSSPQVAILEEFAGSIAEHGINVTIEARAASLVQLETMYNLITKTLKG